MGKGREGRGMGVGRIREQRRRGEEREGGGEQIFKNLEKLSSDST